MEDNRNVYKSRYGTVKYRKMDRNRRKGKLMIEVGILMREPKRKEERKKRGEKR